MPSVKPGFGVASGALVGSIAQLRARFSF